MCNRVSVYLCFSDGFWGWVGHVTQVDQTDFILHFGDLSYALGRGYLWETFGNLIDPFASRAPYMVSVGYVIHIVAGPLSISAPVSPCVCVCMSLCVPAYVRGIWRRSSL
jgi:hypothetical protein